MADVFQIIASKSLERTILLVSNTAAALPHHQLPRVGLARAGAVVLVAAGAAAAGLTPVPTPVPGVAMNSPFVFQVFVFTLVPAPVAVVWSIAASVASGAPFEKLSVFGISLDRIKEAKNELAESAKVLDVAACSAGLAPMPPEYEAAMSRLRSHLAVIEEMVGE